MKKLFVVFAAVLMVAGISQAQGISGSAHDFSTGYTVPAGSTFTATPNAEVCIVCHAPHTAVTQPNPLWNRVGSLQSYDTYGQLISGQTAGAVAGSSLVCLSCHDGSIGIGSFGGNSFTNDAIPVTSTRYIGTDLTGDHPISVTYTAGAENGLNPTTNVISTAPSGLTIGEALEGGQVQCGSCHNVHNESGVDNLLHSTNANSDLCLKCHIK